MKQYNVTCPICGTLNKELYLDETDGWMECEHCHNIVQDGAYHSTHCVRIPVFTMEQLARLANR